MGDVGGSAVALRPLWESDLDGLFDQMRDPESVRMAAFTPDDPDDRQRFDARMARLMKAPEVRVRAVTCNGEMVGGISSFVVEGRTEVAYWIDRSAWGRGIASRALVLFLEVTRERPMFARAASDNAASLRVLHKAGFRICDTKVSFAPARQSEIEESLLRLE